MRTRTIARLVAAVQVVALCLGVACCPAYAAGGYLGGYADGNSAGVVTVPYRKGTVGAYYFYGRYGAAKENGITGFRTSNKRVVTATTSPDHGKWRVLLIPQGYGTARVSFKYRGKTRKITVKVVKATCPVTSITSGTRTLKASKLVYDSRWTTKAGRVYDTAHGFVRTGKRLRVAPAKGWKVESIVCWNARTQKYVTIKNGAKVPSGSSGYVRITLHQPKTGVHQMVWPLVRS